MPFQVSIRVFLMLPWIPPAKNARMDRFCGCWPLRGLLDSLYRKLISGMDTSLEGLKPSDLLALHNALIMFLYNCLSGFFVEISGA